ncbi:hypothetical protein [Micromonospora sp. NPDC005189]|uniref:hypothetical protein n=1 Tax=unclassified Micromonospora TaxID=2617518 RepID=UPI0033AD8806
MKITSSPERSTSDSAGTVRFGRRHAKAAAMTVVGLVALAQARSMPWVAVHEGQDSMDRLVGRTTWTEVRTYALTDLAGFWPVLYVGWALLLAMLVVAWVRPPWRPAVRLAAALLSVVLAVANLLPGGAAVDASGFAIDDYPSTNFLGGLWLALFGMLLLAGAVSTLPMAPTPAGPAAPPAPEAVSTAPPHQEVARVDESAVGDPQASADTTSFVWQSPRLGARPATAPWWRRPGPVAGVVAGAVAAAVFVTVIWYAAHPAVDLHPDLGALVVAAPSDSKPADPAAVDDQVDFGRILPVFDAGTLLLAAQVRDEVLHAAGTAWTRRDATSVTITLVQFSSVGSANHFERSYVDLQQESPGEVVEIDDVPGAMAFVADDQGGVWAVARQDEIVVVVSAVGGSSDTVTAVESLVREQYDRI